MGHFIEVWRRRGLKVKAAKSKVMLVGWKERLSVRFVQTNTFRAYLEFKYLGCVLDESGTDEADFSRKVASGRRVAGFYFYVW